MIKLLPQSLIKQLDIHFHDSKKSPIEKLENLKFIALYPVFYNEETTKQLRDALKNQQESLLLYLIMQDNQLRVAIPINDDLDLVTELSTTNYNSLQSTYLLDKKRDISCDLTYVDAYQEDDGSDDLDELKYVTSYIYGDYTSDDWTYSKRTYLEDLKNIPED